MCRQRHFNLKLESTKFICALFVWLISHQPAVLFSQNKSATSNQPIVLFSQNKSAPAISHQLNEHAAYGNKQSRRRKKDKTPTTIVSTPSNK
jgi:hypothetical protein